MYSISEFVSQEKRFHKYVGLCQKSEKQVATVTVAIYAARQGGMSACNNAKPYNKSIGRGYS